MKININIDNTILEDEILINCKEITEDIIKLQKFLSEKINTPKSITLFKNKKEYFIQLSDILFFETDERLVYAHTRDNLYETEYKLYELTEFLPENFIRISKSAICNIYEILSINKNIASGSSIEFQNTNKKVYVSRSYYKTLIQNMNELILLKSKNKRLEKLWTNQKI